MRIEINDLKPGDAVWLGETRLTVKAVCGETVAFETDDAQGEASCETAATNAAR